MNKKVTIDDGESCDENLYRMPNDLKQHATMDLKINSEKQSLRGNMKNQIVSAYHTPNNESALI